MSGPGRDARSGTTAPAHPGAPGAPPFTITRIGIALAAYNPDVAHFAAQLDSIQRQTFSGWTCVIAFDSPLDEVRDDPRLAPFLRDERFIWRQNPERLGHPMNFARAIERVAALPVDAIAACDQDDIWYPAKLEACARALERAGRLALVHSDMDCLQGDQVSGPTVWTTEARAADRPLLPHLLALNVVSGCSMLFDAELARRYPLAGGHVEHHDHWYAIAASCFGGVHAITTPLLAYRQHERNVVGLRPFRGLLSPSTPWFEHPVSWLRDAIGRSEAAWVTASGTARDAEAAGLPLDARSRQLFIDDDASGLWLLGAGISALARNRAAARAFLSLAIGRAAHERHTRGR